METATTLPDHSLATFPTVDSDRRPERTTSASSVLAVVKRVVALALATLVMVGGLATLNAAPASAATTGNVTFCLKYANGAAYANKPVYLYQATSSGWTWIRSGSTAANGCATWKAVPKNNHYATQGYWSYAIGSAGYYYNGWTGSAYLSPSATGVRLPTGTVYGPYRLY